MAAGEMVELTAANGDIDTTDNLVMFEAYQKVFVINGSNLKIADFINTKLTVTALTTAPTRGSTVTQSGSGATMIVDFVNSAKTEIYGYTTGGTFTTTAGQTLSGGSMSPETRVPSAVDEATDTPHWYDYTVYPDGSSGSLPDQAYLGCVYRGRIVLSGNPDDPHQWYMSRQADPYDYAYTANDAQSPVAGGNADAGKIGDIIRCLIPYKDDYLIFGCASSIHVLRGDPCAGGSRDELDRTVGIFGANSWCFDGDGNLYFWGNAGIYRLDRNLGSIINLTQLSIPDIVGDESADPSTHRITLSYDRKRYGLLIYVTTLATGSNSNYFFSLNPAAMGFYPESYPSVCGVYSSVYYDAKNKTYRDLLVGCTDGYIRKYDDSAKNDDSGSTDTAISSYVLYPIIQMGEDDEEGKLTTLILELAGGASGGSHSDMDGVTYSLYTANDAETLLEDIKDGATAAITGTLSGTGRQARIRQKLSGAYLGIVLSNSTASETFVMNKITGVITPTGRIK